MRQITATLDGEVHSFLARSNDFKYECPDVYPSENLGFTGKDGGISPSTKKSIGLSLLTLGTCTLI